MSSPLAERATRGWVRTYTRRLPEVVRGERLAEVDSDLWEHREDVRERGLGRGLEAIEIAGRLVAGMGADLAWRNAHVQTARGARRAARIRSADVVAATATSTKHGYPTWLAVLGFMMGAFGALMGITNAIAGGSAGWGSLLAVSGTAILVALWLVNRAPWASLVLLAAGALAFGFLMYWLFFPIVAGVIVAAGAAFSAPRVLRGSQPSA